MSMICELISSFEPKILEGCGNNILEPLSDDEEAIDFGEEDFDDLDDDDEEMDEPDSDEPDDMPIVKKKNKNTPTKKQKNKVSLSKLHSI